MSKTRRMSQSIFSRAWCSWPLLWTEAYVLNSLHPVSLSVQPLEDYEALHGTAWLGFRSPRFHVLELFFRGKRLMWSWEGCEPTAIYFDELWIHSKKRRPNWFVSSCIFLRPTLRFFEQLGRIGAGGVRWHLRMDMTNHDTTWYNRQQPLFLKTKKVKPQTVRQFAQKKVRAPLASRSAWLASVQLLCTIYHVDSKRLLVQLFLRAFDEFGIIGRVRRTKLYGCASPHNHTWCVTGVLRNPSGSIFHWTSGACFGIVEAQHLPSSFDLCLRFCFDGHGFVRPVRKKNETLRLGGFGFSRTLELTTSQKLASPTQRASRKAEEDGPWVVATQTVSLFNVLVFVCFFSQCLCL